MIAQNNIITGERLQQLAHYYLGDISDFQYNPLISIQHEKQLILDIGCFDTLSKPCILFCYGHKIKDFSILVNTISVPFVLITHNSDENMFWNESIKKIVNSPNLKMWYAQNLAFTHNKVRILPIGFANSMWRHGNLDFFANGKSVPIKNKKTFFNFNIVTNREKRLVCYNELIYKLPFLQNIQPTDNLKRLSEYEFCICPEGNGLDTHRLWEALYLHVVPIVLKGPFTDVLLKEGIPLVVLNRWSDYNESELNYSLFADKFNLDILQLNYFREMITKNL
jgi:hypothetical protein